MIRKIVVLLLIVFHLNCATSSALVQAIQKKKEYVPYEGTLYDLAFTFMGPSWKFLSANGSFAYWIFSIIDLPFSFVLDTVLLPGTVPYYIYVSSGRPGSKEWHHNKFSVRLQSFQDQNPPYGALKSIIDHNDVGALQRFLKSYDVVALEKKIRSLQDDGLLPYKHIYNYHERAMAGGHYFNKIGIIDYMAAFFSNKELEESWLRPRDRLEIAYTLYEEFRNDPILEKRYYNTVWKVCFSSGILIENPKVLKKILQEFSERREIYDLFEPIALRYPKKEYKKIQKESKHNVYSNEPPQISEHWYERIKLLTEIDKLLEKNPELQKKWRNTAWHTAISSGIVVHRPQILEKSFREFPKETEIWNLNLFIEAHKNKNRQSIDIITKNLTDAKSFPLDRLEEKAVINILEYPNLLEKLLQTGWDPNQILEWKKSKFRGGKEFIEKERTTLLILAMEEDSVPADTLRTLLKYGVNPGLGVKRNSEGKEYTLYPLASVHSNGNGILKELKQKILIEQPLKEFHTKYPTYSLLQSYVEKQNVRAFEKTLAGIDLVSMEKEMRRLQKENFVPMEIPRTNRDGSDKTSILGSITSLARVRVQYKDRQECWAFGKYAEAIEIQKAYYSAIQKDENLKRSFLEDLGRRGAFWEDPIFSEQMPKLLSGDRVDWSGFELEDLVQHKETLDLLMKQDSKMETGLKQKIVAVSLFCGKPKSAEVALKYFSKNDYLNFSSDYVNFLLNDFKILELFLKNGMNPNSTGRKEYQIPSGCPLLVSVVATPYSWDGIERLVQLLLKYGADPNFPAVKTSNQKQVSIYPLSFISRSEDRRLFQILKASGANENLLTPDSREIGFGTYLCRWR
ncbi:YceK/YidQ family lipoprotein [Leptospira santarosai]|uniref:YceK/YidQ family lipoprotein n=1 Tax=Leptospira santarosai TaxID=28183 RepID=UPI0024AF6AE8|nr:YceK/YidQ family lipoprotein [Leptospira santarosai]MDI7192504.1 YceK/YidQ family lipoprotein [Leptospira santarosai]MDO6402342.1 YceK/YidQ family lipoprotein [Leptospira santarosai]